MDRRWIVKLYRLPQTIRSVVLYIIDVYVGLNSSLSGINVYVGDDKKIHFVDSEGADSVLPFNSGLGDWKQVYTNTVGDSSGTLYSINASTSEKTKLIKVSINKYGNDFIATITDSSGLTINKTSPSVPVIFLLDPGCNINLSYKWSSSWDRNSCTIAVFENELQLDLWYRIIKNKS